MGLTFGVGGALKGHLQEQLLFGGTAFASLEEAAGGFLGMWDLRLPGTQRFFFSAMGMSSYFPRQRAYVSFNLKPGEIRAGTNESDKDDFIEDGGSDNWVEFKLEYVMPLRHARKRALMKYRLKDGLLQSGASGGKI